MLYLTLFVDGLASIWKQAPALLYGLAFLIGCGIALKPHITYLFPILLVWAPLYLRKPQLNSLNIRLFLALACLVSAIFYVNSTTKFPPVKEMQGLAKFEIETFSINTKHYGSNWHYTGKIRAFIANGRIVAKNLSASIQFPTSLLPAPADKNYQIEGTLREIAPQRYVFLPNKDKPWIPIKGSFSTAKWRYQAKTAVSSYIRRHIKDPQSANFLSGIATGDFQDRLMSLELGRFGLQHIMAISGFHFAIIAALLNFLLSFLFSKKYVTILLIFLLSSYFLFLGNSPSVMRSWIASIILLASFFVERKSSGLNALGIALLFILICEPQLCTSLGFQFSFVTTTAIFLLNPGSQLLLQKIFPTRPLSQMIEMDRWNQLAYIFLNWCKSGLALTLAINAVALPLTLFYFAKFPLLSFFYNLFFPFMVSISMTLLLVASACDLLIPYFGQAIHLINDKYTHFLLSYTYNIPSSIDVIFRSSFLTLEWLIGILCVTFIIGILILQHQEKKRESFDDWNFI